MRSYRKNKLGRVLLVCILTILFTWSLWVAIEYFFRIQKVEIVGSQVDIRIDKNKMSKNLLFFPTESVKTQLLEQNALLKNIEIQKKYPGTLRFVMTTRQPIGLLVLHNRTVFIDEDGVFIDVFSGDKALPSLLGMNDDKTSISSSLHILKRFKDTHEISSITKVDSETLLAKIYTIDIYFPQNNDMESKVATLQTLLDGFRIKGTLPKMIDLRFEKPIITF